MEKVLGIGGFFFRGNDPEKLNDWYEKHLGISHVPQSYEEEPWRQKEGATVFCSFDEGNDYLAQQNGRWILNFRVADLDAMVRQLRDAGIEVQPDPETYPNGRFAWLHDPEGNPIQLWEEAAPD